MFSRILVPLDGSALAEQAIYHAEQFARLFNSTIILLQVLEPDSCHENPETVSPLSWQIRKAEIDTYMQGVAARIRESLGETAPTDEKGANNRVSYSILEGKISESIVDFAHAEHVDLLIISTHGSGGLSRWNMSSITQKVINLIYSNVLLVRAYRQAQITDRIHYRRILLPIDSSLRAENSISAGVTMVRGELSLGDTAETNAPAENIPEQAELILAAVVKSPEIFIRKPYPTEVEQLTKRFMEVSLNAASKYLNNIKKGLAVDCETDVVEGDAIHDAIEQLAVNKNVDLVILGAHGHSGQLMPYGAVTHSYMEHGTKHVLIIQDIPLSEIRPTQAEIAARELGKH